MTYYGGDVTRLSDEDLKALHEELLDESYSHEDFGYSGDPDNWEHQASQQLRRLEDEIERRHPTPPSTLFSGSVAAVLQAQNARILPKLQELFETSDMVSELIRKGHYILPAKPFRIPISKLPESE